MAGFASGLRDAVDGGAGFDGARWQVIVVHLGLAEDAVSTSGRRRSVVGVHLVIHPLRVAQVSGLQCRIQGKEGLDERGLRS